MRRKPAGGGCNRFCARNGDDRHNRFFHLHLSRIGLGRGSQLHFTLCFVFTLATSLFVDALATLSFDALIARGTAGTTLTFALLFLVAQQRRLCTSATSVICSSVGGAGVSVAATSTRICLRSWRRSRRSATFALFPDAVQRWRPQYQRYQPPRRSPRHGVRGGARFTSRTRGTRFALLAGSRGSRSMRCSVRTSPRGSCSWRGSRS